MMLNEKGFSVYLIISILLILVLVFGNLTLLNTTPKKNNPKAKYLENVSKCPENTADADYIVFGKFFNETIQGTVKQNFGCIVLCPNLAKFPKHFLPKGFYENMEPTELQNYFVDDLEAINSATGSDGTKKLDYCKKYIEIWKTDPTALARVRANGAAIRNQILLGLPAVPVTK